eukprot:6195749-Pleurochrysis_carterae.AAC.2
MHRHLCVSEYLSLPVVYIALASLYCSQRVSQPSQQAVKRLTVALTMKGRVGRTDRGGKRAEGLIEELCLCVIQRRFDPELSSLLVKFKHTSAAAANFFPCTHARKVSSWQQDESSHLIGDKDTLPSDGDSRNRPPN